jgi:hypothetical protein
MISYKNKPADLKIRYLAREYEKIESMFENREGELPQFMFMLSLLGFHKQLKIPLDSVDEKNNGYSHEFSMRTLYPRNEAEFDTYFGFIAILDNTDLTYEEVINQIAFERTEMNNEHFLKMKNVRTFFEYMLGGVKFFNEHFRSYSTKAVDVADAIHTYLTDDQSTEIEVMEALLLEQQEEQDD